MTSIDIHSLQDHRTSWNTPSAYDGSKSPRSVDDSVFHVWQKPDTGFHDLKSRFDDQMFGGHSSLDSAIDIDIDIDMGETIVFDDNTDHDDDVIMQIDENEGLLNANDFYDSISNDVGRPQELLADAVLTNVSTADDDTNSFFSCESSDAPGSSASGIYPSQQRQFQESLHKLNKSMKKSQATRKSLYAKTPKLKDYQRSSTVHNVLQRIEYSSRQIDSYYHHSASSSSTRMMMSTFS
mmetsp:Transcript_33765/g.81864  ORF Transcript_33765/g.81864 Transcript_33765/m.81864 type:complete len:238 (+) Transcript_33765:256-969(+)|eukprot:CAMPEP_0113628294 /NCGR_PEP_ID=MMETSP0017_2-20120614/14659_1 /TAXON_ID=2856 /ORGANISM="Cylindrotheca closterium" /LENGTH=237 /DNA_ID=CAMNT_0000538591 /DNA_START=253 /DNA_END=966 /DNA_ORIENTATION=+ /assembly_acc=CAM_ASM_000147